MNVITHNALCGVERTASLTRAGLAALPDDLDRDVPYACIEVEGGRTYHNMTLREVQRFERCA